MTSLQHQLSTDPDGPRYADDIVVMPPLHAPCIRDRGLTLGEMFDLEALAADCVQDGSGRSSPPRRP